MKYKVYISVSSKEMNSHRGKSWNRFMEFIRFFFLIFCFLSFSLADTDLTQHNGSVELGYPDEKIDYNERFHFYGGQGRIGFGRFCKYFKIYDVRFVAVEAVSFAYE